MSFHQHSNRSLKTKLGERDILTKRQLCETLNISMSWVDILIKDHGLPHIKIGEKCIRFDSFEVAAFLERRKRP